MFFIRKNFDAYYKQHIALEHQLSMTDNVHVLRVI